MKNEIGYLLQNIKDYQYNKLNPFKIIFLALLQEKKQKMKKQKFCISKLWKTALLTSHPGSYI